MVTTSAASPSESTELLQAEIVETIAEAATTEATTTEMTIQAAVEEVITEETTEDEMMILDTKSKRFSLSDF